MHVAVTVKRQFLPLPCIVIKGEVAQYSLPMHSPWETHILLSFSRNSFRVMQPAVSVPCLIAPVPSRIKPTHIPPPVSFNIRFNIIIFTVWSRK